MTSTPHDPAHTSPLQRIPTRAAEVGGITVRRAVPTRALRTVGAWCFLDQAGPARQEPGQALSVGPHPHIGLQTFTWMIEGEIMHRDSLGVEQRIRPGEVNLMTAGHGIAHAEESTGVGRIHSAQLWIALPESRRHGEPAFEHYADLPVIEREGLRITLLVGDAFGRTSPVRVYSPLAGMDLHADGAFRTSVPLRTDFEYALLCLDGVLRAADEPALPGELLYLGQGRDHLALAGDGAARALLIGGTPFDEDLLLWWNFVARTQAEIEEAAADWQAGRRFGDVPGTRLARLAAPDLHGARLKPVRPD